MMVIFRLVFLIGFGLATNVVQTRNGATESQDTRTCLGVCQCVKSTGLVDCSNVQLHKMPSFFPCWATRLYLNNNQIEVIDADAFSCLNDLVTLNLGNNQITTLRNTSFANLPALKSLILRRNLINTVEAGSFAALKTNLEELDLTKNNWNSIDPFIFQTSMPKLQILRLVENGIQKLYPDMFTGLFALTVLDLETNLLSNLGSGNRNVLEGLTSLEELYIGSNFFSYFPGQNRFDPVKQSLRILSFSNHFRISSVPRLILPSLEEFSIAGCGLQSWVNDTVMNMTSLKKLDLSNNKIQILQAQSLVGPTALTNLDISFNSLLVLPYRALSETPSLYTLVADYLGVQRIGPAPSFLSANFLKNLSYLSMERNSIKSVDDASFFSKLVSLKTLKLSYSPLDYVPRAVGDLDSLEELVFDGNAITNLSAASFPVSMPSLQHLMVRNSPSLRSVENNTFSLLGNLTSVTLSDNSALSNISQFAFEGTNSLHNIDITNNAIEVGFSQWFSGKSVDSFLFSGNKLTCDCTAQDFFDWVVTEQYSNITTKDEIVCYTPRMVRDRPLSSLSGNELSCDNKPCPLDCLCFENTQSSIVGVDCSAAELKSTPQNLPETMQILRLDSNFISSVKNNSFENLKSVVSLYLSNNQISDLEIGVFWNLSELRQLYLQNNRIGSIETHLFENITLLEELRIDNNRLSSIGTNNFRNLNHLRILDASKNAIEVLDWDTFLGLGKVDALVLASNIIEQIHPDAFSPLRSLQVLYLASNRISTLPKSLLDGLPKLVNVDLSGNSFKSLPGEFLISSTLLVLDLETNGIATIENMAFSGLSSLQTAKLGGNKIETISPDAFATKNDSELVNLDLMTNLITHIPVEVFQPLVNLQSLYLDDNPISSLDVNASALNQTQPYLPRLTTLHVSFTSIEIVTNNSFLSLTPKLESLLLSECRFNVIPSVVMDLLPELEHLVLDGNQIETITARDFPSHKNLKSLSLRFMATLNEIGSQAFSNLPALSSLKLSECGINHIASDAFHNLVNLKSLDMSQNQLSFPDHRWFSELNPSVLTSVSLWGNPWLCNCSAAEYKDWLNTEGNVFTASSLDVMCYDPLYVQGSSIQNVKALDMCANTEATTSSTPTSSNGSFKSTTTTSTTTTTSAANLPNISWKRFVLVTLVMLMINKTLRELVL